MLLSWKVFSLKFSHYKYTCQPEAVYYITAWYSQGTEEGIYACSYWQPMAAQLHTQSVEKGQLWDTLILYWWDIIINKNYI